MSSVVKAKKGGGLMGRASFVAQGLCAGLVLLLAACVGDSSAPDPGLTVSPASLSFTAAQNGAVPPSQDIQITISREDAAFIGVGFPPSVTPPAWFDESTSRLNGEGNNWTFTAAILSTSLAPGVYTTTVRIVIADVNQNILAFRDVQVSYTIQPAGISAAPPSLIFSQAEGGPLPAAQAVALSELGNASYAWNALALYSQESGWLGVNGSQAASGPSLPSSISVGITTPQRLGTHSAAVRITGNGNVTDIPVSYVVRKALLPSPTSLSYTIGNTPLPADMTRQISVGAFPGVTWTATSSATWLTLSAASGGSGDSLSASLVQAEVDAKNNGRTTATITLTPSVGSTETIPVTLTVARTQVNYLAPYIAIANTQNEVLIRGDNLDQVTITSVKFGTTAATSFNLVSGTEIRAIHPSLAPGTYPVRLETNLGVARSLANDLVAVAAQTYAAATIAYPNATAKQPLDIIYDAERQALLVGVAYPTPGSSGEIFRYPFTGSAWATTPASVAIASFRDLALSFDGRQLIAVSDFAVQKIDAAALTMGTVTPPLVFETFFKGVAMANDGNAILTTGSSRFERSPTFAWFYLVREDRVSLGFGSAIEIVRGTAGASADGSLVILSHASPDPTPSYDGQYDSQRGLFSFIPSPIPGMPLTWPSTPIRPKLDRKAIRLVLNGYIVIKNSDYSHQSFLPPVAAGDSAAVALSPDGTRAYQYVSGTLLRTFDVSSPDQGVSEIGEGTVLPSDPGASPVMTVSPDGGTLFIAGADGIVVVPAP
jgi:BACON domain-containing protein/IPT/TIG domain-containing protein